MSMPNATGKKKTKLAKGRLDTFYHLAKEHGYRSRASFKLIQLNKKYNFLDNAHALVDLCAAPGGWLQVAQKHMPVGSVIIGVDLQEIKAIRNVITFSDDITKPSCIRTIQGHLKNTKVDVVLHDGAPNMGTAWAQDAYSQVDLTLKATKTATLVLKKGGWYITKVFRSEDYNSLLWVFNQLFQKVEATKPIASRSTSAEIYVVCRGYLAPSKLDPRLLDSRFVFKQDDAQKQISLNSMTKGKKNRSGYETEGVLLFKKASVSVFLNTENPVQALATHSVFEFDADTEAVAKHAKTTPLIKTALQDLKVLSKAELKTLLKWRSIMRYEVLRAPKEETEEQKEKKERDENQLLNQQNVALSKRDKRRKKRELAQKRKTVKKLQLKMSITGDKFAEQGELFNVDSLKNISDKDLEEIVDDKFTQDLEASDEELHDEIDWSGTDSDESDAEEATVDKIERDIDLSYQLYLRERDKRQRSSSLVEKSKLNRGEVKDDHAYDSNDSDREMLADDEQEEDDSTLLSRTKKNPLLLQESIPKKRKVDMWFSQGIFDDEDLNADAEPAKRKLETEQVVPNKKVKTDVVPNGKQTNGKQENGKKQNAKQENGKQTATKANGTQTATKANGTQNGAKANGTQENGVKENGKKKKEKKGKKNDEDDDDDVDTKRKAKKGFEVVPQEADYDSDNDPNFREGINAEEDSSLDEKDPETDEEDEISKKVETLAIATSMIRKKNRQGIEDNMFSRYTFNDDEDIPEWFAEQEEKYYKPNIPLTKADIQEIRARYREINSRPIKKVAEALARKKRRTTLQVTKAKERANAIAHDESLTPGQKISQVNKIMKKANQKQGKEKVYVVGKKSSGGTSKKRKHVKHARVRLVDSRMKKEARAHVRAEKSGSGHARKNKHNRGTGAGKGRKGK